MDRSLFSCAAVLLLTSGFAAACGSSGSESPDAGPPEDSGKGKDGEVDARPHDAGKKDQESDSSPGDAGTDADLDAMVDAGPKCEGTPKVLVDAKTLTAQAAPADASAPFGEGAPAVEVYGHQLFYVLDAETSCSVPPPSPDSGPPVLPEGGCGGWTGSIWSLELPSGKPTKIVSDVGQISSHFLVNHTGVYFAASPDPGTQPGSDTAIFKVALTGGKTTKIAKTNGLAGFLATDGSEVYWNDEDGIKAASMAGGSSRLVTSQPIFSFAAIGTNLVLADFSNDQILEMPSKGGATTTLATGQDAPLYPLACGKDICWLNAGNFSGIDGGVPPLTGQLQELASGTTTTLAQSGELFQPFGLVFDGTDFFVANGSGGSPVADLLRIPASGSPMDVLVSMGPGNNGLAIDDQCVYWGDIFGGLYSLSKTATGPFTVK